METHTMSGDRSTAPATVVASDGAPAAAGSEADRPAPTGLDAIFRPRSVAVIGG